MSSTNCSSGATTTVQPLQATTFESPRSIDSDRSDPSSFSDIHKPSVIDQDQSYSIVLQSNDSHSIAVGYGKPEDSPIRSSGITTPTSFSDGDYPASHHQNNEFSQDGEANDIPKTNGQNSSNSDCFMNGNGTGFVAKPKEYQSSDCNTQSESNHTGMDTSFSFASQKEVHKDEQMDVDEDLNDQNSKTENGVDANEEIDPIFVLAENPSDTDMDGIEKPSWNGVQDNLPTTSGLPVDEVIDIEKEITRPATPVDNTTEITECMEGMGNGIESPETLTRDSAQFDRLNATIERVALREREIARARKEAEEARNVLENGNFVELPAHNLDLSSSSSESHSSTHFFKNQLPSSTNMVPMDDCQSTPSTSAFSDMNGLPPLDPVDTNFSQASTPLPTPSETSSTCSVKTKRRRRDRTTPAVFCEFTDTEKGQCKQRAILTFHFCIRHILADPEAPYKQCQHKRKPKNKKEEGIQCTNAIAKDQLEIYCTTHLIMKGLKEPKKKKKADDVVSTLSLDGSEAYNESVMTNASNPADDASMNSFTDNAENGFGTSNGNDATHFDHRSQDGFERPPQSFSQGLEPQPSTSYFNPEEQSTSQSEPQETRQEKTFQLIQKPNGEHALIDECGILQPPESYNLIKQPDGSLQVIIHQIVDVMDSPPESTHFKTPPQSAPPMFDGFQQPELPQREPQHSASCDATPQKMYDHPPFPPPTPTSSAGPCLEGADVSRMHPQLAARLFQPSNNLSQLQGDSMTQQALSDVLLQKADGSIMVQPLDSQSSRPESTTGSLASNLRTMITYPDGTTQILPPGTQIIQTENGAAALLPSMVDQEQFQVPQILPYIDTSNVIIPTRAPAAFLPFEKPPRYLKAPETTLDEEESEEDEEKQMLKEYDSRRTNSLKRDKMICLRQKRQRTRIGGSFRKIPAVDEMARVLEDHDFDKTDLFPLGLEPSDDEMSSEEEMSEFGPKWWPSNAAPRNTAIEVYLQKKTLKLEKAKLIESAVVTAPLMHSVKDFPNASGAALRTRDHYKRELNLPEVKPFRERRCYHMQSSVTDGHRRVMRCPKPCLPRANHCSDHILYNIDQKLYFYCERPGCSRPTLPSEALLTEGLCRHHFEQYELAKESDGSAVLPPSRPSSARYVEHYPPAPSNVTAFDNSTTILSSASNQQRPYCSTSSTTRIMSASHAIQSNPAHFEDKYYNMFDGDGDDGEVSLASVAKDLGINSEALNEVLAQVEEEPMDLDKEELDDLGHNWADVEQFLLSEGYPVDPADSEMDYVEVAPPEFVQPSTNHGPLFDSMIYNEFG